MAYADLLARDLNLDITWPDAEATPAALSPRQTAREIMDELSAALEEFAVIAEALPDDSATADPREAGP